MSCRGRGHVPAVAEDAAVPITTIEMFFVSSLSASVIVLEDSRREATAGNRCGPSDSKDNRPEGAHSEASTSEHIQTPKQQKRSKTQVLAHIYALKIKHPGAQEIGERDGHTGYDQAGGSEQE